ncbi:LysR family transcriptional regulator, partial [Enterococcus faecalis]
FNRQGQTTTLTPAGFILEKFCWRITNELVSIEEELKEINHSSNLIYVATYLCDLEYKLNVLLMTTLTDRSSNLQVHTIITENILQSLETMDADFGISF